MKALFVLLILLSSPTLLGEIQPYAMSSSKVSHGELEQLIEGSLHCIIVVQGLYFETVGWVCDKWEAGLKLELINVYDTKYKIIYGNKYIEGVKLN